MMVTLNFKINDLLDELGSEDGIQMDSLFKTELFSHLT